MMTATSGKIKSMDMHEDSQDVVELIAEIMVLQANYLNETKEQVLDELEELIQ